MSTPAYSAREKALLDQIRTRGHWEMVYRPIPFTTRLDSSIELLPLVQQCVVDLAGWRFPYLPQQPDELAENRYRQADWLGQTHRWEHHLEVWRFYTTGQFAVATSVSWDWRDESGWWPLGER